MKIVVNTRSLLHDKLDGIGWFTYQTMRRIVQKHPEHDFIFLFDRPWSQEFIFASNVRPVKLFPPARHPFLYLCYYEWSLRRLLRKEKPDLFVAPDGLLCLGSDAKQLAVIHDINFLHYPKDLKFFYSRYYNLMVPRHARKAAKVVTVSDFSRRDISNNFELDPNAIDVVYNGIQEGYREMSEAEQSEVRNKFSQGKPYFLFVGSLSPRKNLVRLLQSFELFKTNTNLDHQLVLAGGSFWGDEQLHNTIKGMKHGDSVHFTGRVVQDELEKLMGSAFALTFVSYFEGFGIPLVEAMQCGVPILSSNTSCMPEIAGDAALYTDPFNVDEIAAKMELLARDETLRKNLIEKGRNQKLKFSWDRTADLLWKAIMDCIQKGSE